MKRNRIALIAACLLALIILCLPVKGTAQTASPASTSLNDFQKEAVVSIREITLQLILIAMGIFAVIGGFATTEHRQFTAKPLICLAFMVLGTSVIFGLLAYGRLIWSLGRNQFDPSGIAILARTQWACFALGGIMLMVSVLSNIRKADGKKEERRTEGEKK